MLSLLQWTAELNAAITQKFFAWLVGPLEVQEAEVEYKGQKQTWKSGVQIKKCRYLEQSGCKGMCINMCKVSKCIGVPCKNPVLAGLGREGGRGRGLQEGPCSALLLWQGIVFILNNDMLCQRNPWAYRSNVDKNSIGTQSFSCQCQSVVILGQVLAMAGCCTAVSSRGIMCQCSHTIAHTSMPDVLHHT